MSLQCLQVPIDKLGYGFTNGNFIVERRNNSRIANFKGYDSNASIGIQNEYNNKFNEFIFNSSNSFLNIQYRDIIGANTFKDIIGFSECNVRIGDNISFNTDNITFDHLKILREKDALFIYNIETKKKQNFGTNNFWEWNNIENNSNDIYLDGNLYIDNDIYINGSLTSNHITSNYVIDNTHVEMYRIGEGYTYSKSDVATVHTLILNDGWHSTDNKTTMYSKRNIIVNGNIYISGNIITDYDTSEYILRDYSGYDKNEAQMHWCNVEQKENSIYTDRKVIIEGNVFLKGTVYNFNSDISNISIIEPILKTDVSSVNLIDKVTINDHLTVVQNESIQIAGITSINGDLTIAGDLNVQENLNILKKVYEHTYVYNAMKRIQKRYTYNGQIPINKGKKHEIGYNILWTTSANAFDMFELKGSVLMTSIERDGLRSSIDFNLVIDPSNNGIDRPGLDKILQNESVISVEYISVFEIKVDRVGARQIRLAFHWETNEPYKRLYKVSIELASIMPVNIGRNTIFGFFYDQLDGEDYPNVSAQIQEDEIGILNPYEADPLIPYYGTASNIAVIEQFRITGANDIGPALQVFQGSFNLGDEDCIAEFWDSYNLSYEDINRTDGQTSKKNHDMLSNVRCVRIGQNATLTVGAQKRIFYLLNGPESGQLNVVPHSSNRNPLHIYHNPDTAFSYFDQNVTKFTSKGQLIIHSRDDYQIKHDLYIEDFKLYKLYVNGDILNEGSITTVQNGIVNATFFKSNDNSNVNYNSMDIYICWNNMNNSNVDYSYGLINVSIDWNISSTNEKYYFNSYMDLNVQLQIAAIDDGILYPDMIRKIIQNTYSVGIFTGFTCSSERIAGNMVKLTLYGYINFITESRVNAKITVNGSEKFHEFKLL
jgi:uncharacterized protein YdeI (BOF family)